MHDIGMMWDQCKSTTDTLVGPDSGRQRSITADSTGRDTSKDRGRGGKSCSPYRLSVVFLTTSPFTMIGSSMAGYLSVDTDIGLETAG